MEVDGYALQSSDQEDAVKAINDAKNPLKLLVQSLVRQQKVILYENILSLTLRGAAGFLMRENTL